MRPWWERSEETSAAQRAAHERRRKEGAYKKFPRKGNPRPINKWKALAGEETVHHSTKRKKKPTSGGTDDNVQD